MNEIFNVSITDKIEIFSRYNFNKDLNVIVYNSNNEELYRTIFPFEKNIIYWIGIEQSLDGIILRVSDEGEILYEYQNI